LYLCGARDPCDTIRASMFLSVLLLVFSHRKKCSFPLFLCHTSTYIHGRSKLAATVMKTESEADVIFLSK
jgi:hypothetical protein